MPQPDFLIFVERGLTNLGSLELNVRLSRRPTIEQLEAYAAELKAAEPGRGPLFIRYYLAGLPSNAGPWALISFNPEMFTYVRGLTEEHERELRQAPLPTDAKIVGAWIATLPLPSHRTVIYGRNGKTYLARTFTE